MSHRNRIGVATALWLAVLPGVGSGQAGDTEPIKTTLCELVKEPAQFNGKFVQLRATIRHGFEVSLVVDESCSVWLAGPGTTYMSVGNVTLPVSSNSANVLWWVGMESGGRRPDSARRKPHGDSSGRPLSR
jgi:hypothetical protein